MKRRTAFLFDVLHRSGTRSTVLFYALTAAEATRFARAWAQKAGHRRVELRDEEQVA